MDYLVPLWVRQYLTQRQRREIPEDVADHLLSVVAEALQDRDPATLSHPRTHSIHQSFAAILRQKSTSSTSSTLRSKFPFGSTVATFRKLGAMDLDPLNSQEIVRMAIYVMKRSTLEFVDPLTCEQVHTEGERKNNLFRVGGGVNNNNTANGSKTGGLAAASDVYLCKDFHIGQNVLHNPAFPISRAAQSVLSMALFCARASGLRSKTEPPPSATGNSYPLTAAASMAGSKWLAKLGQVMFGGPCSQSGHNHHRRTRASLELLERQNIELGRKILEEQKQAGLIDPKSGQTTIRRPSVVQASLTPPDTRNTQLQGGGNKDLAGSSSSSDFVPLFSISQSTSTSTLSTTSRASSSSGGPGLEKWCRHCSRALSCLVLAQLQETSGGLEEVGFDDSGFAGTTSLSNSGFEFLNGSSRTSSSSSLSKMDMPSQSNSSVASSFMGASGESASSGSGRRLAYRDPRPHLEHKSDLLNRAAAADRPTSPFILFDRSHVLDENEPPSSIPSPLFEPSSVGHSGLALSLADAFGSDMASGLHGRAMQPRMNSNSQNEYGPGQLSEGEGSPIQFKKFAQSKSNIQDTDLDMVNKRLGNDSILSSSSPTVDNSHPLQHKLERTVSTSSREEWERMVVGPQKTKLELDLEQAVADSTPVMASSTTAAAAAAVAVTSPVTEMPSVRREPIADTKEESRSKGPIAESGALVGLGLDQGHLLSTDVLSPSEDPEENRSPVTSVSAEEELDVGGDGVKLTLPRSERSDFTSASAGSSPVSPESATEGAADPISPAHEEALEEEAVPDDRADVTQERNEPKPSRSPSSFTSSSPSSSSSSSSSDSSASSFRSATQPNSPVSDGEADDDHRNYSGSDLDPASRPHTPGAHPSNLQALQTIRMLQKEKDEEESLDEDSEVDPGDDEDEDEQEGETVEDQDGASSNTPGSPSSTSPKVSVTPEHRPFYAVGLHGQASTDSYAREIEQSMMRKTPPQDSGRTSRRASKESDRNDEAPTVDKHTEVASDDLEENTASKELKANEGGERAVTQEASRNKDTPAIVLPVKEKETLTLKASTADSTKEEAKSAAKVAASPIQEETKRLDADEGTGQGQSPPSSSESERRPFSSISASSSFLSEDPSLASSSVTRDEDDSDHSADELDGDDNDDNDDDDEDNDYLNTSGDGDGFVFDLSSGAMASSSSLLSSSSSLQDIADPSAKNSSAADQKRQKLQQRRKKRLLVDDAKRKQEQLDKIKAQLELKTLGKIRQQVSFWEEKGVLEQKVVGVVDVEDEPTEDPSLTTKQTKQDPSHLDEPGNDNVHYKAEKVPSSAPPSSPQRN